MEEVGELAEAIATLGWMWWMAVGAIDRCADDWNDHR